MITDILYKKIVKIKNRDKRLKKVTKFVYNNLVVKDKLSSLSLDFLSSVFGMLMYNI